MTNYLDQRSPNCGSSNVLEYLCIIYKIFSIRLKNIKIANIAKIGNNN